MRIRRYAWSSQGWKYSQVPQHRQNPDLFLEFQFVPGLGPFCFQCCNSPLDKILFLLRPANSSSPQQN